MTAAGEDMLLAEAVFVGTATERHRMACWLARSALENAVEQLVVGAGWELGTASMRSRLTVLRVLHDQPEVAAQAHYAWARLSQACHRHSYALSPTYMEVRDLLDQVAALCLLAERGKDPSSGAAPVNAVPDVE